jgi:tRNA pseudouridine55 synthase
VSAAHGIFLLDKPLGLSSNQALTRVKRAYGATRAGHTGALDPLASGMLPCCLDEATKVAGHLLDNRKAYVAVVELGSTTTTDDREGEVLERHDVPALDEATLRNTLSAFVGRITQRPPIYSALKRDGVPLYKRARRGEVFEAPLREVDIDAIELDDIALPRFTMTVTCGSGTYIRSLARDIGAAFGCGAHLAGLRRTWVDPFCGARMYTLDELESARLAGPEALAAMLLPMDAGLAALPALHLDAADTARLRFGQPFAKADETWTGACRVYADDGKLAAIAERDADGIVRVKRGINS